MNSSGEKKKKHPSLKQLAKFLNGELSPKNQSIMEKHLEKCDRCVTRLEEVESDTLGDRLLEIGTAFIESHSVENAYQNTIALLKDHDRYELIERIGAGGMGDVFRACQRAMDRPVAIKVLKQHLFQNDRAVARFQNEVKVAARLNHPNIVHSYDAEVSHGLNILVMELVEGDKLSDVVSQNGPLSDSDTTDIALQIASGLEYAANEGMIHRDIKPQNIMLIPDGKVKITDFGLAKFVLSKNRNDDGALTVEGEVFGTPDYIAPEQIRNSASADVRSDIYSLGCTLYFALCGIPPFPDRSVGEKLASHLEHLPMKLRDVQPDVDPGLEAIVAQMMNKDPDSRFQSYAELSDALKGKWTPRAKPKVSGSRRRNIVKFILGGILALAALWIATLAPGWFASPKPPNPRTGKFKFAIVIPSRHAFHPEIQWVAESLGKFENVELEYLADQVGRADFSLRKRGAPPDRIDIARTLSDVEPSEFDAVVFTGGWDGETAESTRYAFDPSLNSKARSFIESMMAAQKPIGSICAGTIVLANANLLEGIDVANCHYIPDEIKDRSGAIWSDLPKQDHEAVTVADDLIITGGNYINAPEMIRLMMKLAKQSRESRAH